MNIYLMLFKTLQGQDGQAIFGTKNIFSQCINQIILYIHDSECKRMNDCNKKRTNISHYKIG